MVVAGPTRITASPRAGSGWQQSRSRAAISVGRLR